MREIPEGGGGSERSFAPKRAPPSSVIRFPSDRIFWKKELIATKLSKPDFHDFWYLRGTACRPILTEPIFFVWTLLKTLKFFQNDVCFVLNTTNTQVVKHTIFKSCLFSNHENISIHLRVVWCCTPREAFKIIKTIDQELPFRRLNELVALVVSNRWTKWCPDASGSNKTTDFHFLVGDLCAKLRDQSRHINKFTDHPSEIFLTYRCHNNNTSKLVFLTTSSAVVAETCTEGHGWK